MKEAAKRRKDREISGPVLQISALKKKASSFLTWPLGIMMQQQQRQTKESLVHFEEEEKLVLLDDKKNLLFPLSLSLLSCVVVCA